MEEKRILSFEDIDNSIEILGVKFDLEFSKESIDKLRNINIDKVEESEDVLEELKNMMNKVLNDENAYDKVQKSYKDKKGKEFGIQAFFKIWEFIFEQYDKEINKLSENNFNFNQYNNQINREQRRNYNRNKGKRNYRRY